MADDYFTVPHLDRNTLARIFSKIAIDPVSGCWNWTGALRKGYGTTWYAGRNEATHRVLYAFSVEPVPRRESGRQTPNLDHVVCNNTRCCNPAHLNLVTPKTNVLRGAAPSAVNAVKTHCPKGHPLPTSANRSSDERCCRVCQKEQRMAKAQERRVDAHRYYAELKADPSKYAAYLAKKRNERRLRTIRHSTPRAATTDPTENP